MRLILTVGYYDYLLPENVSVGPVVEALLLARSISKDWNEKIWKFKDEGRSVTVVAVPDDAIELPINRSKTVDDHIDEMAKAISEQVNKRIKAESEVNRLEALCKAAGVETKPESTTP